MSITRKKRLEIATKANLASLNSRIKDHAAADKQPPLAKEFSDIEDSLAKFDNSS